MDISLLFDSSSDSVPLPEWCEYVLTAICWLLGTIGIFVFSYSEYFLFSLSNSDKEKILKNDSSGYSGLKSLLNDEKLSLSSIVTGYWISVALIIAVAILYIGYISNILGHCDTPNSLCQSPILTVLILIATFVWILLFADVLPHKISKQDRVACLYYMSKPVRIASFMLYPFSSLLKHTEFIACRLEVKRQKNISLDELSETLHSDSIKDKEEKDILESIVTFGSVSVGEILRPRVDVVAVNYSDKYTDVLKVIRDNEYSRMPVYDGSVDNVKGILYVKDFLNYLDRGDDFNWQHLIRAPFFVPESKKIDDLLREFQVKRMHMAIVVDEFGGTSGIVTMEDILEVIFGDISDEHDVEQKLYTELDKRNYLLEGKMPLSDFYKIEKIDASVFEALDVDADTVAGLILSLKGDIPSLGDEIIHEGYIFKIVSVDKRRIKKIKLRLPDEKK
ncbi:MAG: gliding motility-associated protein GldE [Paludibacteraceae bacterium]|nr:gliding motility-associated protein GldE [Paludibacteraceae bacterium]